MTALSPGLSRLILLVACLGVATVLCILDKIPGEAALGVITVIVGGVLHGAGARQGAEAAKNDSRLR